MEQPSSPKKLDSQDGNVSYASGRSRTLVLCFDGTADKYDATVSFSGINFYLIMTTRLCAVELKCCQTILTIQKE